MKKILIVIIAIMTGTLAFGEMTEIINDKAKDSKTYKQNNKREIEIIQFNDFSKETLLHLVKKESPRAIVLGMDDFTITAYSAKGDKLIFIEDGSIAFIKNSDHLSNREALEITKQMLENRILTMK